MVKDTPDSVLEAAKKTAAALDMPWAELQPIYRELQSKDENGSSFLPKSAGRKIYTAVPEYIKALLIALGFSGSKVSAHDANYIAFGLAPGGREMPIADWPAAGVTTSMQDLFNRFLTDPDEALNLDCISFDPSEKRIAFRFLDGKVIEYLPASGGYWGEDDVIFRQNILAALRQDTRTAVTRVVEISGKALAQIARDVVWRSSPSPIRFGEAEETDD